MEKQVMDQAVETRTAAIIDLGDAVSLTRQFSEGDDDSSPTTSGGKNLTYPPVSPDLGGAA
jgi:hypothetical protein